MSVSTYETLGTSGFNISVSRSPAFTVYLPQNSCILLNQGLDAVSYTHLDVYKRQVYTYVSIYCLSALPGNV